MAWLMSRVMMEGYGSLPCSPGQGAASSEVNSLAGEPSAPLKSNPTPQAYLPSDRMTAFSRLSRFGMMFAPLTDTDGEAVLMSYLAAFP